MRLALASPLVAPVKLRQGWALPPPLKQKCTSAFLGVQALEDWGIQEAEERGLGHLGGGITQRASLPESPLSPISSTCYPVLLGLPISGSYLFHSASPLSPSEVYQEISG